MYLRRAIGAVALVTALGAAACGNDDASDARTEAPAAPSAADVAGSDQHLTNQADEIAREQRANAAATARLTAQAEAYERQAHLAGQANTARNVELAKEQASYQAGAAPRS